jgi:hypothetical protein
VLRSAECRNGHSAGTGTGAPAGTSVKVGDGKNFIRPPDSRKPIAQAIGAGLSVTSPSTPPKLRGIHTSGFPLQSLAGWLLSKVEVYIFGMLWAIAFRHSRVSNRTVDAFAVPHMRQSNQSNAKEPASHQRLPDDKLTADKINSIMLWGHRRSRYRCVFMGGTNFTSTRWICKMPNTYNSLYPLMSPFENLIKQQ